MYNVEKKNIIIKKLTLFVLWTSIILLLYAYFRRSILDDSFIYYRIAQNINNGSPFLYNNGEPYQIFTSPLNTYIQSIAALFIQNKEIFVHSMNILYYFWIFLIGIIILNYFQDDLSVAGGFLLIMPLVLSNTLLKATGMETSLFITMTICSILFYCKEKSLLCGIFAGLAILSRADAIILVPIYIIVLLFQNNSEVNPLRDKRTLIKIRNVCLPPFALIVIQMVFTSLYFGSIFPSTMGSKIMQGDLKMFGENMTSNLFNFIYTNTNVKLWNVVSLIIFVIFITIVPLMIFKNKKLLKDIPLMLIYIFCLFSFFDIIAYCVMGVAGNYFWYYTPYLLSLTYSFIGIFRLFFIMKNNFNSYIALTLLLLNSVLIIGYGNYSSLTAYNADNNRIYYQYKSIAEWVNNNTPDNSVLGVGEAGIISYYCDRKIYDYFFLTTPYSYADTKKYQPNGLSDSYRLPFIRKDVDYWVEPMPLPEAIGMNVEILATFDNLSIIKVKNEYWKAEGSKNR